MIEATVIILLFAALTCLTIKGQLAITVDDLLESVLMTIVIDGQRCWTAPAHLVSEGQYDTLRGTEVNN